MSRISLLRRLAGRDLPVWQSGLFLLLVVAQIAIHLVVFFRRPVGQEGAAFYPAHSSYQNIDTPTWVMTGAMLPGNAPAVRSMRPLYPSIITVARVLGIVQVPPALHRLAPGAMSFEGFAMYGPRGIKILIAANILAMMASLWLFFALSRHFGLPPSSAILASLAAGSGFGFGFWLWQATPEVFGFFTSVVALATMTVAVELERPGFRRREAAAWALAGGIVGILLLGKELYFVPIFGGLFLLGTRRWIGLAAFCVTITLPTIVWNWYMARVVGAYDPKAYLQEYKFVVWLWQDLAPLPWSERLAKLWDNLARQLLCLGRAYAYAPLAPALIGMSTRRVFPRQGILLGAYFLSIYLLFLASNFIVPRLLFIAWPVVYFYAWIGILTIGRWAARRWTNDERLQSKIVRTVELASLLGLVYLGTFDQYRWYSYG